ncbi:S-adenosyl-L-methionine-dependent methyltransferase [Mytilinidion resinicola]|uniref:S-adenosyl-L-methionine-dependent methyltransferase n=1 Tax=Mytilinidion resinicola TaxID=574789 RepID=A0A6A6YVC3_9PEZI|nr:S-adenosyl-L-methionine-dependent methyltransferase [Mytilinidion resinicola]KAF2811925.1 S-adenosyl-L-methionine-dependent methyltransferase [Mytilinidion resinicola]
MPESDSRGEAYEAEHVHAVYEQIAAHFSSTRYKPWPIVSSFLSTLPAGSIGLDVGCGNGKYLALNPSIYTLASDRSTNLAKIAASHQPHSAIVADNLALPHPLKTFDFAISIAVVHHLSTVERRREAVGEILAMLREGGRALVYVWALEQKGSRRGWDKGGEQDVMVPWVMKGPKQEKPAKRRGKGERTFQRYYHLYRKGELEEDVVAAGGTVVESGYEKDNWWAIATPREAEVSTA